MAPTEPYPQTQPRPRRRMTATRAAALAEQTAYTDSQILDAAETLFARFGLRGTRVREIAAAAGVNEATLYNYYKNKEALYVAVLERGIAPIVDSVRQAATAENSPETIRLAAQEVISLLQQRPQVSRLLYLEAIADGEHLHALVERWLKPFAELIMNELNRRAPQLEREDYPQIIELFWHLSFGHFAISPLIQRTFAIDNQSQARLQRQVAFIERLLASLFVARA